MSMLALAEMFKGAGCEGAVLTPNGQLVFRDPRGQITCLRVEQLDLLIWQRYFNHRDSEIFTVAYIRSEHIGAVRFPTRTTAVAAMPAAILFRESIPTLFPNFETALAATEAENWLQNHGFIISAGL